MIRLTSSFNTRPGLINGFGFSNTYRLSSELGSDEKLSIYSGVYLMKIIDDDGLIPDIYSRLSVGHYKSSVYVAIDFSSLKDYDLGCIYHSTLFRDIMSIMTEFGDDKLYIARSDLGIATSRFISLYDNNLVIGKISTEPYYEERYSGNDLITINDLVCRYYQTNKNIYINTGMTIMTIDMSSIIGSRRISNPSLTLYNYSPDNEYIRMKYLLEGYSKVIDRSKQTLDYYG